MIDDHLIDAFIACEHKGFLIKKVLSEFLFDDFDVVQKQLKKHYKRRFIELYQKDGTQFIYCENTHFDQITVKQAQNYLVDICYGDSTYHLHFDLAYTKLKELIPIYPLITENPTQEDKLRAVVKALIFNAQNKKTKIKYVLFIKGETVKTYKIQITSQTQQGKKVLLQLNKLSVGELITKPQWKSHCTICCFQKICRKELQEKDDLSLISGLKPKEIAKKKIKGVFSITQLSYTFSPKKKLYFKKRFLPELKALALREQKTYVINPPLLKEVETELYFDIEGIPDSKNYYLIGLIIKDKNSLRKFSFWAEDTSMHNFIEFLDIIIYYADCPFYHFSSFEITVLKYVITKIEQAGYRQLIESIIQKSINLLKEFSENVYPPTYTNSLKEIANFLGFEWQDKDITGYKTIFLYKQWQIEKRNNIKEALIRYNMDDCKALIVIKDWLSQIERNEFITKVSSLKTQSTYKFGDPEYIIPEWKEINHFAYFNYQRDKVYFKTNTILKAIKKKSSRSKAQKPNQIIIFPKPDKCYFCGHKKVYKHDDKAKIIFDLKINSSGIKRWIISFNKGRIRCAACCKVFNINNFNKIPKYGRNLMIWSVNQNISYNISFRNIANSIKEQFDIHLPENETAIFNSIIAKEYMETYQNIKKSILAGSLLHIDESPINIKEFEAKCYVWVFATMDSVFYLFRKNREAGFLKDFLQDFKGVVVSDFYAGYDSLECAQQKCLIHLIRDLNDDLLKNPFNEEFKFIIKHFTLLLRNIIDTINKYGLKRRHLYKHVKEANRFFDNIFTKDFETEIARAYYKKFKKYREKLFVFLNYDGVPWNNNNAEVAIKPFAIHRNYTGGLHTEKGINDYLILLSIQQTCRYRKLSFFEFLKSNIKNI
ncbi:TM0106 family RecB-like putative nuclease [Rhodocytophaga aerolata]|uniref:TM0106 family RecB-like putative nuclease n=1 Tax=Rhodocytophaga aerolata TaxID=455078 RepID=A0ABT8RFH6_9BACT|nr:TM0106 family RecB-like putative nuclease [Rhodocytophaga aerolata]MDO1450862.1 TM0106 family RecB-like putative nuclease [Rhodocytophaga aerolata]